jgi:hypothetical protein
MGKGSKLIINVIRAIEVVMIMAIAAQAHGSSVKLAWDPPASIDGTPLQDLAGFRVCYGVQSKNYTVSRDVGMALTVDISGLDPNTTYYIAVRAYSVSGAESDTSEEVLWAYDADADSLPDTWENEYFGGLTGVGTGPDDDFDGDRMSNGSEFVAGTSPIDEDDYASVAVTTTDANPSVSFRTIEALGPGCAGKSRTYTLEQCTNLTAGVWSVVPGCGSIPATGLAFEVRVAMTGTQPGFYRTRISLE